MANEENWYFRCWTHAFAGLEARTAAYSPRIFHDSVSTVKPPASSSELYPQALPLRNLHSSHFRMRCSKRNHVLLRLPGSSRCRSRTIISVQRPTIFCDLLISICPSLLSFKSLLPKQSKGYLTNCYLSHSKMGSYFQVRNIISDFSVFLSILIMTLVSIIAGLPVKTLDVPKTFEVRSLSQFLFSFSQLYLLRVSFEQPTKTGRSWIVDPLGSIPTWVPFACAVPALLLTVLVAMDQQITAVIVNRNDNKLKVL